VEIPLIGLIDGDLVAFRCAATAENEADWIATSRAEEFLYKLLREAEVDSFEIYLSSPDNFRYSIFPEYKANRINTYRPKWEKTVKDFLIEHFGAASWATLEADDVLAIRQTELKDNSIIVSIDKDMLQVPGWHYQWEQVRKNVVVKPAKKIYVSEIEGLRNFYKQLIIGDAADGIKGVVGAGPKAAAVLDSLQTEKEMFDAVRDMYSCDEEMLMNGQVLWLQRKLNKVWTFELD
jgi:5'-3' exonuclease